MDGQVSFLQFPRDQGEPECLPLTGGAPQRWEVRVLGVAQGDAAGQFGDLNALPFPGAVGRLPPGGFGQVTGVQVALRGDAVSRGVSFFNPVNERQ